MKPTIIGDPENFSLMYTFEDNHRTELSMFINGANILAFERDGKILTTRWNLDEVAFWLRSFVNELSEDPFPVDAEGEYAAQKDDKARDFDSDDDEVFDTYYDRLYDWNCRHRWHSASSGAILSDVYFQLVGEYVEVSWNNESAEEGVRFVCLHGGARIERDTFCSVVNAFLKAYADHWFPASK